MEKHNISMAAYKKRVETLPSDDPVALQEQLDENRVSSLII